MKKFFTSVVLFATALLTANAQQLQTGDSFTYTTADGVEKTYMITGDNLIENPSFDNGATGWTGGDGKALGGYKHEKSGGVDGGAYLIPGNGGKGGNASLGTAWAIEKGKTYVFSYYIRQINSDEAVASEGYIVTSETNTPQGDETKTIMYAHEDANKAWTQNLVVTTAEYDYLQFCARWLGSNKGFDAFILAEVSEVASPVELEQLLESCDEWMNAYDDPKDQDVFQAVVTEANNMLDNFDNYNADQVNAMVHKLKEALLDYRVVNASDEIPVDVTSRYIKNPNFDNGMVDWTRNNDAVNAGTNIRFFEYFGEQSRVLEINGNPSKDTHIKQTIYNLPMGYYRFTVQCVMNHSVDASDPDAKSGVAIYCNSAELDMKTQQITTDGATKENSYPESFTIEGVVSADSIVVGLVGYAGSNFTYVAIDNVTLEYAGFDAGVYIDGLIENIYDWMDNNSDFLLPGIAIALEDEIAAAEDKMDGTEEEMNEAYKQLDAAFAKAKESVALMEQLDKDYEAYYNYAEETNYPGYGEFIAVIEEVDAFISMDDEEASYDELYAIIAKLQKAFEDYRMSQEATKDTPADYTFLLPNANFEQKGNWVWTVTHSGGSTDTWVGNCRPSEEGGESRKGVNLWGNHLTSLDLHQVLTGLPNGLYGISAELITQAGYATDQHLYVSSINKAVSENLTVEGWDYYEWTTLTTGYVVVTDGTLTIGAESSIFGAASEGWFQATNFKLQYYGPASDEDLEEAFDARIEEAEAFEYELLPGDWKVLKSAIRTAKNAGSYSEGAALLVEPIATAKAAAQAYAAYKNGTYQTAIDNVAALSYEDAVTVLNAAITFAEEITVEDTTTTAALPALEEKLKAYNSYATYLEEVGYMLSDRQAGYAQANINATKEVIAAQKADLTNKFQTAANVADLKSKLENAVHYLVKSAYMDAKAGDDLTALIINPTFDTDASGWFVNKGVGNTETNAGQHWTNVAENRYMDSWAGSGLNYRGSQILTDIPNGTYTVKVATRASAAGAFVFALGEAITSEEVNDSTVMLQVANSAATKWEEIVAHADTMGGIWLAEDEKFQAGSATDDAIYNANNGRGFGWTWATIDDVVVANHTMIIGVTTDSTVTKVPFQGTWFSADDWSLTLKEVGDNSNWEIGNGIENVTAIVKETTFFAIDGRRLAIPAKGINIVKTVYNDGRIEVKKVFVK